MNLAVELAINEPSKRGGITPWPIPKAKLLAIYQKPAWRSYFVFEAEPLKAWLNMAGNKSVKGYPGQFYAPVLVLDYEIPGDDGSRLDEVQSEVLSILKFLEGKGAVVQPWYSGRKGFHIETGNIFGVEPSASTPLFLRDAVDSTLRSEMLDSQMIHESGTIRLNWSRHDSTIYHKIPLSIEEMASLGADDIRALALEPSVTRKDFVLADVQSTGKIFDPPPPSKKTVKVRRDPIDVSANVSCMQSLLKHGTTKGRRHQDLLRVASWAHVSGMPLPMVEDYLVDWVGCSNGEAESFRDTIRHVYKKGYYNYGCFDRVKAEYCQSTCVHFLQKQAMENLQSPEEMGAHFQTYLQKVRQKKIGINLGDIFPGSNIHYRMLPGEVSIFTGDTGMGKTALVQNIVTRARQPVLWLNLEMNGVLVFRRFIQIDQEMSSDQVDSLYLDGSQQARQFVEQRLQFITQMNIAPTIKEIQDIVAVRTPSILVVDTTDAIEVPHAGSNDNFHLKTVVEGLRKSAQAHNVLVMCIHHLSKSGSAYAIERGSVHLNDLTGSRTNVTKMDHVIAFDGNRDSPYRRLYSLKTRDGGRFSTAIEVDWRTFRFQSVAL